jgi:1,4-dihydroxy-2-naphthoyl-CoA synthase
MTEEGKEGRNAFLEKRKPNLKKWFAVKVSSFRFQV